ncbi:MAG: sigma-70 family RNA polymerase sigma factor [Ruminococcus sp.]|nr:sigma-70 family RNA polymerase sigma factor [Ruminococcus sp.]
MRLKNYGNLDDSVLAMLTKKGDGKAFEEITIRYIKLIYSLTSNYKVAGYETQDLVQEGLLSFLIACSSYDEKSKASYKNYAVKCAKNRFNDLIKKANAKSSVPDSRLVSMDELSDKSDEKQSVEDHVLEREYLKTFLQHLNSMLTSDERRVFNMYAEGYAYKEIAEALETTPKKVDNILQKIKRKFRQ